MTASAQQLSGIQMLRGIAAVSVVFLHGFHRAFLVGVDTPNHGWLTTVGAVGVDLFFVISGFIMLYVSFREKSAPPQPGRFLLRRVARIYPFYWICCFGVVVLWMAGFYKSGGFTAGTITQSIFLLPNQHLLTTVSWTLSYEMFFYLIFAATLVFRSRVVSALLSTFVITAVIIIASFLPDGEMTRFLSNPVMLEFCFGLLLALAWSRGVRATSVLWMVPGFLVIMAVPLFVADGRSWYEWPSLVRPLVWGLPAVAVLAGFLAVGPSRLPWARFCVLLGDASYAIYLTHTFIMEVYSWLLVRTAFGELPQLPVVPVVVGLAVAVGIAAHIFIEAPIITAAGNFLRTQRGGILAGESSPGPSV